MIEIIMINMYIIVLIAMKYLYSLGPSDSPFCGGGARRLGPAGAHLFTIQRSPAAEGGPPPGWEGDLLFL